MSTYAFEYAYDAAGNRTKQTKDGVPTFYHYDAANELLAKHEDDMAGILDLLRT